MVKLNDKPLNLYVRSLDIEERLVLQKCLLPASCLAESNISLRPGDWAKCHLNHGYSSICQVFMRGFSKDLCYMDANVISANCARQCLQLNNSTTNGTYLEHLELLQVLEEPVKSVDLVFVLSEVYFMPKNTNNSNKNALDYLLHVAQPMLQSLKFTHNCSIISGYLEKMGIVQIQLSSTDEQIPDNVCFNCSAETQFRIIDVRMHSMAKTNGIKKDFQLPMFEKVRDGLQLMMTTAQQQLAKTRKDGQKKLWPCMALNALISGPSGVGKTCFVSEFLHEKQANCFIINSATIFGQYPGETQAELRRIFNSAKLFATQFKPTGPTVIVIKQLELLCPSQMDSNVQRISSQLLSLVDELHGHASGIICLALTTSAINNLNSMALRAGRFDRDLHISAPTQDERRALLANLSQEYQGALTLSDDLLQEMAVHTRGYVTADLELLLRNLCLQRATSKEQILKTINKLSPSALGGAIDVIVQHVDETFNDIGGMHKLKQQLNVRILVGLQQTESYKRFNLSIPKGVLLYGPPGCGKTRIAKCLAAEAKMTLIAASAAEIYSPYVGCAERFIARLFDTARKNAPCLIFLDEIDSLVGKRSISSSGSSGGGGEVQLRILSTLLTEMDGILSFGSTSQQLLVVAATNRPDMIDDALMRPGRFDKLIHVPAPDLESRIEILKFKARHMPFADDVNIEEIAATLNNYSNADVCNLCYEAALQALHREMNCQHITSHDFKTVLESHRPSLTVQQIQWYKDFEQGLHKQ